MTKRIRAKSMKVAAASALAVGLVATFAGAAEAASYSIPTGEGNCTMAFNTTFSNDNGGMIGASASSGGIPGCAAGNVLLQIVCEDYSSPVLNSAAGASYWMIVGGAPINEATQKWCNVRVRWSAQGGAKTWGPEWTIRWTPENGFSHPFKTKTAQDWFPKAP
ncbi:hypothetical protein ACFWB2_34560 [Streptomyces virginiae]|uniref:hypothetical protein n=1 Tax=Streptomyces virginiae TaxID=1961 RepID=UPI00367CCBF2